MRGYQVERLPAPPRRCFSLQAPLGPRARYHWPAAPGHPTLPWGQLKELTVNSKTPRTTGGARRWARVPLTPPTTNKGRTEHGDDGPPHPVTFSAKRGSDSPGSGERPRSHLPPPPGHQEEGTAAVQVVLVAGHPHCPCAGPHRLGSEEAPTHGADSSSLHGRPALLSPPCTVPRTGFSSH